MIDDFQEDNTISKVLLTVFEAMSAAQRRGFEQYLDFEPFDYNQRLRDFYQLLKRHFLEKKKAKTNLIEELEAIGITASQFNKFQTFLHQKLDQFLGMQQIVQKPHRYHSYTFEAYNDLKLDFANKDRKARQILKKLQKDKQTIEHFQELKRLEEIALQLHLVEKTKDSASYYEDIHTLIDQTFILDKLKYLCASLNEATVQNQPFPQAKIEALRAVMHAQPAELPPFGKAFQATFNLLAHPKQPIDAYEATFSEILKYQQALNKEDQFDILNYLLNISFIKVALGEPRFVQFIARIYETLISSKLIQVDGEIPARTFKNIVSTNCRIGNLDWCMQFIASNQKYLPKGDQRFLPRYCTGLVHFYAGNYLEAAAIFREIIQMNPDDQFWGFESRILLLRSYYHRFEVLDTDEYEDLYKLTESFRMYVRRNNELSQFHKQSYLNFVRYLNLMLRHLEQHGHNTPFPQSLQNEIEHLEFITNKNWLLSAISEKQHSHDQGKKPNERI